MSVAASPLLRAVEEGDVRRVALALHGGVDVNQRQTRDGDTLLFAAIREEQEDIVRLVVSEGADLTAQDKDLLEPVHTAAKYGNVRIMDILLRGGADVNRRSELLHMTALFLAVKWQQVEMVEFLLRAGADCSLQVGQGQKSDTPLHYSIKNKDEAMMNLLLAEGVDVNLTDGKLQTPLHIASTNSDAGLLRRLLDCGADIHKTDLSGDTPLHTAVLHGNTVAINALYMIGADLNRLNNKQLTPSHLAVSMGRLEAIRLLIQLGANVDKPGLDELTPLLYTHATLVLNLCYPLWEGTCSQETIGELCTTHHNIHLNILESLIEAGCDMNHPDVSGRRLLNYLVRGGVQSEAAVKLVLQRGADHDLCTLKGATLLTVAALERHNSTTLLILQYCPSLVKHSQSFPMPANQPFATSIGPLVATARYEDVELIRTMLECGYRPVQQELVLINQKDARTTGDGEIKRIVQQVMRNPPTLLLCTRVAIRNILNKQLYKKVTALQLPNRLKDLMLFNDVLGA